MTLFQAATLLGGTLFVVLVVTCDREWRHRKRTARQVKRWNERHEREAMERLARELRTAGRLRMAASVTYPRLEATPLPDRSPLTEVR